MTWTQWKVEIAFATNPGTAPTWVDVTEYVRNWSSRRGRQDVLDRFEAGVADLLLDNNDRRFEPEYAAGAYYPNVLPMRRCRVSAEYSGTTYYLFTGYAEGWPQEWQQWKDGIARVQAADGFKVLSLKKVTASYDAERSDVRIGNVLDDAGWPASERSISTGQTTVQAGSINAEAALSHIQDVTWSENGRVFMNGGGSIVYQDRHTPLKPPYTAALATFGDGVGELPYTALQFSYDDSQLWNDVQVTREGGTVQTASDATSQATYLQRTLSRTGLLMTTDNEALDSANYLLSRYKDPALRVRSIEFMPGRIDTLWPQALGREIGDRVTIKRTPPGGGTAISQDCIIEAIEHDASPRQWRVRWRLSAAEMNSYWILDSATQSLLDSTTRLAY